MIFTIIIIVIVAAVAFFHYVQGFFSAMISAVLTAIAAVLAFSYHEKIVESFLGGRVSDSANAISLLVLFALIYLVLRLLFDAAVPGNVRVPALVEKIGAAVMGLAAGVFAAGIVAIAAQQLPFDPSLAGYSRYETETRTVTVPAAGSASKQTADVNDGLTAVNFDPSKKKSLVIPADDVVIGVVERLSGENGALSAGKPLETVHPDYLQELFAQRLGMQAAAKHTATNLGSSRMIDVKGVYRINSIPRAVEHDFKAVVQQPRDFAGGFKPKPGHMLIAVRLVFNKDAADKDSFVRLSPAAVRLLGKGVENGETVWKNYYPVGTLQGPNMLYANRMDDYLFINAREADKPVDFVFEVDEKAFAVKGAGGKMEMPEGTFVEVKRLARVPLDEGDLRIIKPSMPPLSDVVVLRKELNIEGGPPPPVSGGALGSAGQDVAAFGQRLMGTWESNTEGKPATITFKPDGSAEYVVKTPIVNTTETLTGTWQASDVNGDDLNIKVAMQSTTGKSLTGGLPVTFKGNNQITFTDPNRGGINVVFTRKGPAAGGGSTAAPAPTSSAADPRLVGMWAESQPNGPSDAYDFRADGSYEMKRTGADGTVQSATGKWTAAPAGGDAINLTLAPPGRGPLALKWTFGADNKGTRTTAAGASTEFTKQ